MPHRLGWNLKLDHYPNTQIQQTDPLPGALMTEVRVDNPHVCTSEATATRAPVGAVENASWMLCILPGTDVGREPCDLRISVILGTADFVDCVLRKRRVGARTC